MNDTHGYYLPSPRQTEAVRAEHTEPCEHCIRDGRTPPRRGVIILEKTALVCAEHFALEFGRRKEVRP